MPLGPSGTSWDGSSLSRFLMPGSAPLLISSFTTSAWFLWFCSAHATCRAVFPLNVWNKRAEVQPVWATHADFIKIGQPTMALIAECDCEWSHKMFKSSTFASSEAMWRHVRPPFSSCGSRKKRFCGFDQNSETVLLQVIHKTWMHDSQDYPVGFSASTTQLGSARIFPFYILVSTLYLALFFVPALSSFRPLIGQNVQHPPSCLAACCCMAS